MYLILHIYRYNCRSHNKVVRCLSYTRNHIWYKSHKCRCMHYIGDQTKYSVLPLVMWFSKFGVSLTLVFDKLKCNLYWFTLRSLNCKSLMCSKPEKSKSLVYMYYGVRFYILLNKYSPWMNIPGNFGNVPGLRTTLSCVGFPCTLPVV